MDNQVPVIGILCMDRAQQLSERFKTSYSYISSNYCRAFESASARVVPIWIERDESYYRDIMKCVNGIVLPGGAVFFNSSDITQPDQTNGYVLASKRVFLIAKEMNDRGTYFPLFGICLGFQFLVNHSAGAEVRVSCAKLKKKMRIVLERDAETSKMFQNLSTDLRAMMLTENCVPHSHRFCITKKQMKQHRIADQWRVNAVNKDARGLEFISAVEHTKYPFYGTQFHPERCDASANWCVEYFVKFFISECVKNSNRFPSEADMRRHLVQNFTPITPEVEDVHLKECYIFNRDTDYPVMEEISV